MKNLSKFAIAIIAITVVSLWSCTKEEVQKQTPTVSQTPDVEQKILNFNTKVKSNVKSSETMSLDDAIWSVEASFNYNYGETQIDYAELYTDSAFFTVNTINGSEVSFTEVQNLYNQGLESLTNFFFSIKEENVHCKVVDLELVSSDNEFAYIKMQYQMGPENLSKSADWLQPFGSTDYWVFGNNGGKCGGYSGTGDAAQKIQSRINYEYLQVWGTYYTDPDVIPVYAEDYLNPDDNVFDNMYDYLMFFSMEFINGTFPNSFHTCLSPDEMNFYMNGTKTVMLLNKPQGKSMININLWGDIITFGGPLNAMHNGEFTYGIPHSTILPRLMQFISIP